MWKNITKKIKHTIFISFLMLIVLSPMVIVLVQKYSNELQITTEISIMGVDHNAHSYLYVQENTDLILTESISPNYGVYSSVFGENLLEEFESSPSCNTVNVLVVFDKQLLPREQIHELNLLGIDYTLQKPYKNFPIALVKVSLIDLYRSEEKISSLPSITKIFLDNTQYIKDFQEIPSSAGLIDEENWWLDAIGAKNSPYDGTGVRIAILDTGVYSDHADFASKTPTTTHINFATDEGIQNSSDYEDIHGHGTHVAGIAAGSGTSSSGKYIGVAPGASILNVKTLSNYGGITDSDVIDAVDWIISQDNADIISMSFRTEAQDSVYNPVSIALENAAEHGIVPVASAGNEGPLYLTPYHPSTASSVISVGAINRDLELTSFSSVGPSHMGNVIPDVLAPGDFIIAPESKNSLIGYEKRYTNSLIEGSELNSDYIALSGTSMSAPMVAGAIALILDAYPSLTPEGIRAALYQGAYLPNHYSDLYGANGIGAGIINVSASIAWLDSLPDPNAIIQAFPDTLPYKPMDLLAYPGDSQSFNISILSSSNSPISIDFTISTSPNIAIIPSTSSLSFPTNSIQYIQFDLSIRNTAIMGLETGTIFINDTGTGDLLEQIDYAINITYPKGRVYFDSLHGMNDLYPEWSSGYSQIEIYDAMNVLHKNGYQLVYEMENWTKSVQSQLTSRLLTPDLLSTVDIVVLQTPVVPYTNIEKNALEEFVINGGSILILGTRYQTMPIYSLNSLLTQLNTDITINGENIFDYIDVGFGYILDKYSVSEVDVNSPIFDTNNQFSYWYGATLETGSNADSIATLQNKTVVAAFDSQTGGRVVVWSDYHWLRNDIFSVTNPEEHEHILLNIFDYLNIQQEEDYILEATFNTTIQSSGNLECYVSLLDSSSNLPIPDRIYGDTLNASIISPDHIFTPLLINSLGTGIYSNASFSLGDSDYRPYTIQINVTASTGVITKEYQLYRINSTSQVEISNPTVSNFEITQQVGSSTLIRYIGNSPGLTSQLYGSLTTDSFYSDNAILEYEFSQTFPTIQHDYTFSISPIDHSGLFVFFAVASSPANHTNFEVTRSMVYVKNHDPEINEDDSFFNSIAFGDTREDDSLYILIVNNRNEIDLTVLAEEPVSYEDQTSELYAIVYYTAAASAGSTFDPLYPNSIPTSVLSYSDGQFEGQFKIPSSLSFTGDTGSVEISQQSHADYIYFSVLWITVRDTDGGSVDYLLLMSVNIVFDWDSLPDYLPVIFVILAILGIAITIVTIIKKRRQKGTPQSQYYNNQTGYGRTYQAYCMHCGKQINSKYLVCPYCGKSLP